MAGSINKVILVGNLGKDPEMRRTQDGRAVANLRIATSESWKDKNSGERREKTEWHSVVIFNENLAKIAEQYLRKGTKVYVEGALQTRKWQDQAGNDRYSTEVILQGFGCTLAILDGGKDRNDSGGYEGRLGGDDDRGSTSSGRPTSARAAAEAPRGNGRAPMSGGPSKPFDDEIPFAPEVR